MTVTITPVDVSSPGDGLGDDAYTAFSAVNSNEANFKAAIEELQGRYFTTQNSAITMALGARYMCNNHAGITLTAPAIFDASATAFSDIQIVNVDDVSNVTLTPASGDTFVLWGGGPTSVDNPYIMKPGSKVLLSPRVVDSNWDLLELKAGAWADMTEAKWTSGGTVSGVVDGASAIAFNYDTENTLATAGAKIASWSNNSVEKMSVDKDGNIIAQGKLEGEISVVSGNSSLTDRDTFYMGAQTATEPKIQFHAGGDSLSYDRPTNTFRFKVALTPYVTISDTKFDFTTLAQIDMASLPTADPVVAGRLWNNSNVLNVSTG